MAKKKQSAKQDESDQTKERPGICDKCGSGKFQLRIENHELFRKCKQCGDERVV